MLLAFYCLRNCKFAAKFRLRLWQKALSPRAGRVLRYLSYWMTYTGSQTERETRRSKIWYDASNAWQVANWAVWKTNAPKVSFGIPVDSADGTANGWSQTCSWLVLISHGQNGWRIQSETWRRVQSVFRKNIISNREQQMTELVPWL